jgi:ankyrin repeat protein
LVFEPEALGDRTGKRALHEAAGSGALRAATFLVDKGAEIDPRESSYDGTPIGWAAYGDKTEMVRFLSRYSRDIWSLCFNGFVDRVREILAEDPGLARLVDHSSVTPLWWLPDDEGKAMQIVELLLEAGADPSIKRRDGRTAADWARRRGMRDVATRLERATATSRRR